METTSVSQSVGGIVLCGGRSARMGQPKLTLPFGGEPMLVRVVGILRTTVNSVVVVAAPGQEVPPLPSDVRVLRDEQEHLGPLAGMAVGLRALASEVESAFVSSCDVPLLRPEFISEMVRRLRHHELAVPIEGNFHHPLAAVYRTSLAERARQLVVAQRLRPLFLIQASDSVEVPVDELRVADPELHSLRNLNRPEDYEAALRLAGLAE
jgi:molybdenum cofactor guanylyltransferase